jgi:hypothetical protein
LKDWKHSEPSSAARKQVFGSALDGPDENKSIIAQKRDASRDVSKTGSLISSVWMKDAMLFYYGEFDPGSGRTLAAGLTHASRTRIPSLLGRKVAHG